MAALKEAHYVVIIRAARYTYTYVHIPFTYTQSVICRVVICLSLTP